MKYKWRVFCITEGSFQYTNTYDSGAPPTVCPNDSTHTINPDSVSIVEVSPDKNYKSYVALLSESAPVVFTNLNSNNIIIGETYTITNYISGDDFTNIGALSNQTDEVFIATGTIPTNYTFGSELSSAGNPTAIVLQNELSGDIVWTRIGVGYYAGSLAGAFPETKSCYFIQNKFSAVYNFGEGDSDHFELSTYTVYSTDLPTDINFTQDDGILTNASIEIRVYENIY